MGQQRIGAVVVAGGEGVRLGGVDKAALQLEGVTLLERALAATAAADQVVVVGDRVPTSRPVTWSREQPPGGGPAAGVIAGLDGFDRLPDVVLVLAVDMPQVTRATFERLVAAMDRDDGLDGAVLVDASGSRQPLAAAYRASALDAARPARGHEPGLSMRALVAGLRLAGVPGVGAETCDVDTWADLRALEPRQPPEEI